MSKKCIYTKTGIPGEQQLEEVSDKFVQLLGKCGLIIDQWYGVSSAIRFKWNLMRNQLSSASGQLIRLILRIHKPLKGQSDATCL